MVAKITNLNLSLLVKLSDYNLVFIYPNIFLGSIFLPESYIPVAKVYSISPKAAKSFLSNTSQQSWISYMCIVYLDNKSLYLGIFLITFAIVLKSISYKSPFYT